VGEIKVHFAGTGNAFNHDGYLNQSIIVEADGEFLAIDAGPTFLLGMERMKIPAIKVNQILLTHFHGDHIAGIPFQLINFAVIYKMPKLRIIGPAGTEKRIIQLIESTYPEVDYSQWLEFQELEIIRKDAISISENILVDTYPMLHSKESLGYNISIGEKQFAITGDTRWNPTIPLLMDNRDLGIIECTTMEKEGSDHISLHELLEYRHRLHCKTLIAVHTSAAIRSELKSLHSRNVKVVSDGETIVI
jgi:ribonuclease BN (tRNA processing enzyme)